MKAHPHRKLGFHDIQIEKMSSITTATGQEGANSGIDGEMPQTPDNYGLGSGAPVVRIRGVEGSDEDDSALVSISHDGGFAVAVCLGWTGAKGS